MRTSRSASAAVACLLLLGSGLAACGDDEEALDPEADEEVIEDAIITIDDLPEGFEEQDPEDDGEDENDVCFEAAGVDVDALDDARLVDGETADFQLITDEALVGVTAQIASFSDTDLAEESLDAARTEEFIECVADGMQESAEEDGQDVTDVDIDVIDSPVEGDAAASVNVSFVAQGFPTSVEQHLLLVDRFGISLQVFSLAADVDQGLVEDLLETMAERIEDAVG